MGQYLSGLPAWLVQRLSALYMLLFVSVLLPGWWLFADGGYDAWRGLFASLPGGIAIGLFFLALLWHCWVGMRDIILDYLGGFPALRLLMLSLLGGWLLAMGMWLIRILLEVWL